MTPELVRDLLRAEALGAGRADAVSLRTTHASWVFLVGGDVWKVKRPVDFGFLDFTTVEARRRNCEDEVRLNRRLAPDVYLGVEPVRKGADGRHMIGGAGPVVDWAVHMRRLPDEASADELLARDELRPELLAALAERLASFFATAAPAPQAGHVAALATNVEENFAQVRPFVGELVDGRAFDEVESFQAGCLRDGADLFEGRVAAGRIREGHGDLRLEHVYFLDGAPPLVIDCIEFSERFRCGDVAGDVAFLAMELEAAGRPELAAGFLARFAEASDDFGLYRVLDFYLSYRAWVRGKVAGFVVGDPAADHALRARKREEARRCFALARACAGAPLDAPFVIAVGGLIGSGKTTLAAALGRALGVPVIGSDRVRKAVAGLAPEARAGADLYTTEAIDRNYAELFSRASDVVSARRGAILDATFSRRRWREQAAACARTAGAAFVFVEALCPDRDQLRARLSARRAGGSVSDATDAELDQSERAYERADPSEEGPRLEIDTQPAPAEILQVAVRRLRDFGIRPVTRRET